MQRGNLNQIERSIPLVELVLQQIAGGTITSRLRPEGKAGRDLTRFAVGRDPIAEAEPAR